MGREMARKRHRQETTVVELSGAARRLGATVHSFDYDPESVACTEQLKQRNDPTDIAWTIEPGSVLDPDYLRTLGSWDIVYSWGVLHHTGAMWEALGNVAPLVKPSGLLFISIYNDLRRSSGLLTQSPAQCKN